MTMPNERYRAILQMRELLLQYALKPGPIRKREFRAGVRWALRHYPTEYELERIAKACPELLGRKS